MKGLCTAISGDKAEFTVIGKKPEPGFYYDMQEYSQGSLAQNKAFHSLLDAFWEWMRKEGNFVFADEDNCIYDLATPSPYEFKRFFKFKYGEGAERYKYVTESGEIGTAEKQEDVPQYAVDAFNSGKKHAVEAVLKSWSDYSKKQRAKAIDRLFYLIAVSKCDDKRVHEIMDGMQSTEEKVKEIFQ